MKDDLGLASDIDFSSMGLPANEAAEASKLFQEVMKEMGAAEGENAGGDNPFLLSATKMFKDFEDMTKAAAGSEAGATGAPGDEKFLDILNNMAKNLMGADKDTSDKTMDNIMSQFTDFLKDSENNEEMKSALNEIVNEIISKDSLYKPMKALKDKYPKWLEENWQSCSQDDLEKYNKQMEIINEICVEYEEAEVTNQEKVFELLAKLQEQGQPPESLMKGISEEEFGEHNPFKKL